jgi:hypothetical protein
MRTTLLAVCLAMSTYLAGAEIPHVFQNTIVSIEIATTAQERQAGQSPYRAVGTGFLISPDVQPPFRVVLMTAKHVFVDACQVSSLAYLRGPASPRDASGNVVRSELRVCERIAAKRPDGHLIRPPMAHR